MNKNLLSSIACILFATATFSQTIVSTTPENKKVILEEFTGINCVFCPEGHAIARALQNSNPGNVFLINIHAGGFAVPGAGQPDFRTADGEGIRAFFGVNAYPTGMVNRHIFSGNSPVMGRGSWTGAANQILTQPSYLNMATEASINVQTRELTVHVESYYTGNSPASTNKLNVVLLQNNTLGPQTGGGMGNQYVHQHRLLDLITGQWGEEITTTSTGDFVDRTYTHTIPANHNGIPIVLEDLEIVVFMTETNAEIISGNGTFPSFFNLPLNNDAAIGSDFDFESQCGIDFAPKVTIQNRGNNPLTSLDIDYSINGGQNYTYTWTGNLGGYEYEEVLLDAVPYTIQATNTVTFSIPNDEDNSNNNSSNTFTELSNIFTNSYTLRIIVDENGDEVTWAIKNIDGEIIQSGGPYTPNEDVNISFNLEDIGCHQFSLNDAGGDGHYYIRLSDSNNDHVYFSSNYFGANITENFKTNGEILGLENNSINGFAIFPNPAKSVVTIANAENAKITLYDILGKIVYSQVNISTNQEVNVANLGNGTYFVKIEKEGQSTVEKLIISK